MENKEYFTIDLEKLEQIKPQLKHYLTQDSLQIYKHKWVLF